MYLSILWNAQEHQLEGILPSIVVTSSPRDRECLFSSQINRPGIEKGFDQILGKIFSESLKGNENFQFYEIDPASGTYLKGVRPS